MGRDYGDPGNYDTLFAGLNARMSEFHAAMALSSLEGLDDHVAARRAMAARYTDGLVDVPGVRGVAVAATDVANFKDFTLLFDAAFGLDRDAVGIALAAEGIDTRSYFYPPVHRHRAYAHLPETDLPVTDSVAGSVLSLPMFGDLRQSDVDAVVEALLAIHAHAEPIAERIRSDRPQLSVPSATRAT